MSIQNRFATEEYVDTSISNLVDPSLSDQIAFIDTEDNESVTNPDILSSDVVIDSMLSENSTNPVQNRTIAKEIKTISDDIEYLKRDWEHIETITIEEDGIKTIERSQEPDDTPYNFKKMIMYIYHPISTVTGRTGIKLDKEKGTNYISSIGQQLQTGYSTDSVYYFEVVKDIIFAISATSVVGNPDYETTYASITNCITRKTVKVDDAIKYFRYGSLNSHVLPIGTTMDIYAIRA